MQFMNLPESFDSATSPSAATTPSQWRQRVSYQDIDEVTTVSTRNNKDEDDMTLVGNSTETIALDSQPSPNRDDLLVTTPTPTSPRAFSPSSISVAMTSILQKSPTLFEAPALNSPTKHGATCVICLELLETEDQQFNQTLPCACQARVDEPALVHEHCLRSWLGACARRAARSQGSEGEPTGVTCPLCRAPLSERVAKALELAARVRVALRRRPRPFASKPLQPADGVIRCVVKVHDKKHSSQSATTPAPGMTTTTTTTSASGGQASASATSTAGTATTTTTTTAATSTTTTGGTSHCEQQKKTVGPSSTNGTVPGASPLLLSLYVEGDEREGPLLVARAPRVLGSSRLATKFDILFGANLSGRNEPETPAAILGRNCLGTRWTVSDPAPLETGGDAFDATEVEDDGDQHEQHSDVDTRPTSLSLSPSSLAGQGKRRCTVDYQANRFANRPRAMHVDLDDGSSTLRKLRSRAPEYSPRLHGFCLDFFGRARLASVRNFQIVDATHDLVPGDEEARCLLLFGRWSSDCFHLDVKHPFSLVDAFAIAVSSFATKIATI